MFGTYDMFNYYLIAFAILLIAAVLVANDAAKRGYNGVLWAFIVIIMPMMGLFFYLIYIAVTDSSNKSIAYQNSVLNERTTPVIKADREINSIKGSTDGVFCTACGKPNHLEAGFCKYCGAEIV